MPWVKFTDDWYDDPKVIAAGDDGALLWLVGTTWSARNLTDGIIPSGQIPRLTSLSDAPTVALRCVEAGLFRQVDGGYEVANYHRYQPTRADVLGKREADAARKRGVRADSERTPTPPDPGPVPEGKPSSSSVLPVDTATAELVDDVLDLIADARLTKGQAEGKVRSPKAWRQRCRANLVDELGAKVLEVVGIYDEPAHRLAQIVEGSLNGIHCNRLDAARAARLTGAPT